MNEKLHEALNEISDEHLAEAESFNRQRRPQWVAAIAAMLAFVFAISLFFVLKPSSSPTNMEGSSTGNTSSTPNYTFTTAPSYLRHVVAYPSYPELVVIPNQADFDDYEAYDAAYEAWRNCQRNQYNQPDGYANSLSPFFADSIRLLLSNQENSVYAPLNVYMALAMLAETTDSNSQQQILDLLGADSIEQLRQQASYMWNAHYAADGRSDLRLANALWLDESYNFHQSTPNVLAAYYYTATFRGDLGTAEMDEQLRRWLNENTGELLYDQTQNLSMDPETVFALASTVYFSARWDSQFSEDKTKDAVFHAASGDMTTPFMNKSSNEISYYWGSNFSAVRLALSGDNDMWLILPDEGFTVQDVLESDEYLRMTLDPQNWENRRSGATIHLSLPKFDIASSRDLIADMQALGITDVFDSSRADFSPLTDASGLAITGFYHAARVTIDEDGVVGAAYTVMTGPGAMPPDADGEIYFTLDRPFLFMVSSQDNLPIFAGTVMEP